MRIKNIKFTGNGLSFIDDEEFIADYVHGPGCGQKDITLCGMTLDGYIDTFGDFVETDEFITCPDCAGIIDHCIILRRENQMRYDNEGQYVKR